jgi:hypothetical protein
MYEHKVEFFPVNSKINGEISDEFVKVCLFCDKEVLISQSNLRKMPRSLVENDFFCRFCNLRKNSLPATFAFSLKALIHHYHESFYLKGSQLWASQIEDMVEQHRISGLKNSSMDYDDESFNWFVDSSLVGDGEEKVGVDEVYKSIIEMISCFNMWNFGIDQLLIFRQIKDAMSSFHGWSGDSPMVFMPSPSSMKRVCAAARNMRRSDICPRSS